MNKRPKISETRSKVPPPKIAARTSKYQQTNNKSTTENNGSQLSSVRKTPAAFL